VLSLIAVSQTAGKNATDTLKHEGVHWARALGLFTDVEWNRLAAKHAKGLTDPGAIEEAIAKAVDSPGFWNRIREFFRKMARGMGVSMTPELRELVSDPKFWARSFNATDGTHDPMGAIAWHGSREDFEKFMTEKIGTGEGAQAFGWGLYFAGKKQVAEFYREKLAGGGMEQRLVIDGKNPWEAISGIYYQADEELQNGLLNLHARSFHVKPGKEGIAKLRSDLETSIKNLTEWIARPITLSRDESDLASDKAALRALDTYNIDILPAEKKGKLYEVDLKPAEDEYLDYDKPLADQSEKIQKAIEQFKVMPRYKIERSPDRAGLSRIVNNEGDIISDSLTRDEAREIINELEARDKEMTGGDIYARVSERLALQRAMRSEEGPAGWQTFQNTVNDRQANDRAASLALREAGVRGIRYLDQFSRGRGEGSNNYIIFDEGDVDIVSKGSLEVPPEGEPGRGAMDVGGGRKLANIGTTADTRRLLYEMDKAATAAGEPGVQRQAEVMERAAERLAANRPKELANVMRLAREGGQLNEEETVIAKTLWQERAYAAARSRMVAIRQHWPASLYCAMPTVARARCKHGHSLCVATHSTASAWKNLCRGSD
jgi:hypothetical protein